jgi:hypothetical protein
VFDNKVWGELFGPKREKWLEVGEDCVMRSFITYMLQ